MPVAIVMGLAGLSILALVSIIAAEDGGLSEILRNVALTLALASLLLAPATWATMATLNENPNVALPTATINDTQPTTFMTPNNTVMSANEEAIADFLLANTDPDSYLLATVNARSAAPYILETGRPVLTFGGFSGSDQVVDADDVAAMVANGELRYILYTDTMNQSHRDIANWVQKTCTAVDVPGVEIQQRLPNQQNQNVGLRPPSNNEVLYDCGS